MRFQTFILCEVYSFRQNLANSVPEFLTEWYVWKNCWWWMQLWLMYNSCWEKSINGGKPIFAYWGVWISIKVLLMSNRYEEKILEKKCIWCIFVQLFFAYCAVLHQHKIILVCTNLLLWSGSISTLLCKGPFLAKASKL